MPFVVCLVSGRRLLPNIDTLVGDIYHVLDEDTNHEPSDANIEWIGEAVKQLLRSRLSAREREAATLRFSSLGKPDRQLWYSKHVPEKAERMQPKTYMKFLYGDMIELLLLFLAKEAGHTVEREQEEIEVDGIKGHIDAVIDGVVVDCKSASPYAFKKFASGSFITDDPFGYIKQISGYSSVIAPDAQYAAFLVADKVHGDIAVAKVGSDLIQENNPTSRIGHLKEVLASDVEPERCYSDVPDGKSGNRKLGINCSYCPFKLHCWRSANGGEGLQVYSYSTGPVFLTHVTRQPNVAKIEPF